jgi:hypothetical protein
MTMLLLHARSPAPVRNRVRRFFLFLGSVLLLGGAGLLVAVPDATAISGTATPDKLNTEISVSTEWVSGIYTFSFSPASGWTWYGDQGAWAGWSGRVDILYQWLSGIITMPIGVTDCFESEYWGELTPTGTAGTTPIVKSWYAYAWDHSIKIDTNPVYVCAAGTGLTREGEVSATLTAIKPGSRVSDTTWSAGSVTGLAFSPNPAGTTTVTNSNVSTGQEVPITAQATIQDPFSGTLSANAKVNVVDVNIASSTVSEAEEDTKDSVVFIPTETVTCVGSVPITLSVTPSGMDGTVTLEGSGNIAVYRDAAFTNALISGTQTTATFASASAVPSPVYLKGVTPCLQDKLSLSFTPQPPAGGPAPSTFKDSIIVTIFKLETQTVATTPGNRSRTKLGIGEQVICSVYPEKSITWFATGDEGGQLSPSIYGNSATFRASKTPSTQIIHAQRGGAECMVTFTIVAPGGETVSPAYDHFMGFAGDNYIGAGSVFSCHFTPDDVSFYNVEFQENIPLQNYEWPDHSTGSRPAKIVSFTASQANISTDTVATLLDSEEKLFDGNNYVNLFTVNISVPVQYKNESGYWVTFLPNEIHPREYHGDTFQARVSIEATNTAHGEWMGPWE